MRFNVRPFLIWMVIAVIIVLVFGYYYSMGYDNSTITTFAKTNQPTQEKGQFGDSFGGLNSVLSLFTLIVVVIISYSQFKSAEEQSKQLQQQNLENTFFKLIDLHNGMVDEVYKIFDKNQHELLGINRIGDSMHVKTTSEGLYIETTNLMNYKHFYENHNKEVGHYFRNAYHVLKFIDESKIDNKKFYSNIFRAQFSSLELEFLFFHCLSKYGKEKFKPLIEKYEFLSHLV